MGVIAFRDMHSDIKLNIGQLHSELECCKPVQDVWLIEEYLVGRGIFTLKELNEEVYAAYCKYLINRKFSKTKANAQAAALKRLQKEYLKIEYAELIEESEKCQIEKSVRNKAVAFLMDNGIKKLSAIDCTLRDKYITFLENNIAKSKVIEYTKGLDRLKLHSIKVIEETCPLQKDKLLFAETRIYLSYYPVFEIANSFYHIQNKSSLIWDFSILAPVKLKRQVFKVLIYAVENIKDVKDCKVRYLLPLKWLYQYCAEQNIEDLEQLERWQIEEFREIIAGKVANVKNSIQIIDNVRRILFMEAEETNWEANVWYLERFHLSRERMNPSNPVIRLSFMDIIDRDNRILLQQYVKYQIGVSNQSMSGIRQQYYYIVDLLKVLDIEGIKLTEVTPEHMDDYFRRLEEEDITSYTYNKKVTGCFAFFRYLKVKGGIAKIPFIIEYYLKGVVPVHHHRSVSAGIVKKVLHNLRCFPIHYRLMYLHLWCVGLRVNEVCTLKGNAYYWKDDSAWILVYQNKMRAEKSVPIPTVLYQLMIKYIEKKEIAPNEYIFKSAKGRAYNAGTFAKQFTDQLRQCGIECNEYDFKSHDYRHTVATFLYTHGASLQAVRDYLGHKDDQMTMQYIDYLPNLAENANEEYFNKAGNNLTAKLRRKREEAADGSKNMHS